MGGWSKLPLLEQLRRHNDPALQESINRGYLLLAEAGGGAALPGADATAAWYERNLKIAAHIVQTADSPADRVLVIMGSGHVKLLTQFLRESPSVEVVPAGRYLGSRSGRGRGA